YAAVKIASVPQPSSTDKLRVFAVVLTHDSMTSKGSTHWPVSHEEMSNKTLQVIGNIFKTQGIYEVISQKEIQSAIGTQSIAAWEWIAGNFELVKKVGRALHADYVFVVERSFRIHLQFDMNLINMRTGKRFTVSNYVPDFLIRRLGAGDQRKYAGAEAIKLSYRCLFKDAKKDLLQTALIKGKIPHAASPKTTDSPVKDQGQLKDVSTSPADSPSGMTDSQKTDKQIFFEKELQKRMEAKENSSGSPRLVVYDFESADRLKVAGLILTEALREALHDAGGFVLVNRENILKIMDEYQLQQSGLVDDNSAIKMGKWLAASEAVTGKLDVLGSRSVLQAKRIDIKTLNTLSLASLNCPVGREDELLDQMPLLSQKLITLK
ncbi:MAG TPA: hypothetical protein VKO67_00180, partial [Smithellaceae bacterium]|nr:hypothetical protein [Smithellaceae bacterium]